MEDELVQRIAERIANALNVDELAGLDRMLDCPEWHGLCRAIAVWLYIKAPEKAREIYGDEGVATYIIGG